MLLSDLFSLIVPKVWDQTVERWAQWSFDRVASVDEPNLETYEDEIVDLNEIEPLDLQIQCAKTALVRVAELHERYVEWTPRYSAAQLSQGL